MLSRIGRPFTWAVIACGVLLSTPSWAEGETAKLPPTIVMVVDVQEAIQQSVAGKSIRSQRETYVQTLQATAEGNRKQLKDAEAELMRQKGAMAPEAWQQKARAFEQQVFEFNQRYQKNSQAVEKSFHQAMQDLSATLARVTEEVASEVGATLVMPKSQIFLHDPRMEKTAAVIERLNKKYPAIPFPVPQVDGEDMSKASQKKK